MSPNVPYAERHAPPEPLVVPESPAITPPTPHVGVALTGTEPEDSCPCLQAPCGLAVVRYDSCHYHGVDNKYRLNQVHMPMDCPAS